MVWFFTSGVVGREGRGMVEESDGVDVLEESRIKILPSSQPTTSLYEDLK